MTERKVLGKGDRAAGRSHRGVFTTPWSAVVTYGRPLGEWAENVCAENLHKYNTEKDPAVPTADKADF